MTSDRSFMGEIRNIKLVIDTEDIYNPEVILEDFISENKKDPEPPRYRIITIEILTCPQDGQPVSIGECGKCRKFIRRMDNKVYCKEIQIFRKSST